MSKQFILIKHLLHIYAGQTQDHFSVHVKLKVESLTRMSSIRLHENVADDKNLNITVFYWIIHYNENWTEKPQVFSGCRCVCVALTEQAALSPSYG